MSQVDTILNDIKIAAFDHSVAELARRSGVHEDSVRRLLKKTPAAIQNLKALERAASELRAEAEKPNT